MNNRWLGFSHEEVVTICNALSKDRKIELCEEAASECARRDRILEHNEYIGKELLEDYLNFEKQSGK